MTQPYLSDFSTFAGRCDLARALDIQRLLQTEVVEDSTSQRIELRPTSNVANLFYIQETARICYSDTLLIDKTKTEDAVGFLPVAGRLWHLKTELLWIVFFEKDFEANLEYCKGNGVMRIATA